MPHWVRLIEASTCPPGTAVECVAGGTILAVFNVAGEFHVLDGICPHQGGPLGKGKLAGCIITCPWHGFQFDVTTGRHATLPNLRQTTFPVKVENGVLFAELPDASWAE